MTGNLMRLADLDPRFGQHYDRPLYLRFICPICGPPYTVNIPVNMNDRTPFPGVPLWKVTVPEPPNFSWDQLTITPSIDNTPGGHGRKKPCTFHGSIINGEVLYGATP